MTILDRLMSWLDDNSPVLCVICNDIVRKKNSMARLMTTGIVAVVCDKCDKKLFRPFTGERL